MEVPFFNHITAQKPYTTWYTPGVYFGKLGKRSDDNFFRVTAPDGDFYPQVLADTNTVLDLLA